VSGEGFFVAPVDGEAVVSPAMAVVWLLVVRYVVEVEEEGTDGALEEGERGEAGE
jgi:hypothetical protein